MIISLCAVLIVGLSQSGQVTTTTEPTTRASLELVRPLPTPENPTKTPTAQPTATLVPEPQFLTVAPSSTIDEIVTLPATIEPQSYIVKRGDTLFSIAQQFDTTVDDILAFNAIQNSDIILENQQLLVPFPIAPISPTAEETETPIRERFVEPAPTAVAQIQIIGLSVEGRPITVHTFGNGQNHVLLVGGIHGGYEWNTVLLAQQVVSFFEQYPNMIPSDVTLHIVPVLNPDGLYKIMGDGPIASEHITVNDTVVGRFNANSVDLNRNWDCKWQANAQFRQQVVSGGTAPFSEPETATMRDFILETRPSAVVFWHSKASLIVPGQCGDRYEPSWMLADVYGAASGYPVNFFTAYPVTGDATDWLAAQNIPSIVVELTTQSQPEFEQNLAGIKAILQSKSYLAR